jgi:hypothetical protein
LLRTLRVAAAAISAVATARLHPASIRAALAVILMTASIPLRESDTRYHQRRRQYSKELCHTKSAWLTGSPTNRERSSLLALPERSS